MFDGWQRADVISAAAAAVSGLALMVAIAAARYSAVQAGVARRKERADLDALKPIAEGSVGKERVAGWWDFRLYVKNRLDCSIVCEELRIISPKGLKLAPVEAIRGTSSSYTVSYTAPDVSKFTDILVLDERLGAAGSEIVSGSIREKRDRRHIELFVLRSSTKASSVCNTFEVSLKVRRSSERVSYAEIIVVTKMPPVSTSSEA